jgi:hypothetical protein
MRRALLLAMFIATAAQGATKSAVVGPERFLPLATRRQSLEMAAGHGTIFVVWREFLTGLIGDLVFGTRIDLDGQPLGTRISIMKGSDPRISFDGSRFIVTAMSQMGFAAQYVEEPGTLTGVPFTIADHPSGFASGAISGNVVAWPESVLRAGTISGGALASNVALSITPEVVMGGSSARTVAVAVTPSGRTLIARVSQIGDTHGVFASLTDAALTTTATVILEARSAGGATISGGAEDDLDAAASSDGFAVVWAAPLGGPGLRFVRFASLADEGALVAPAQLLAPTGESPRVVWTGAEFLVVWRQPEGGVYGMALDANGGIVADRFLIAPPPAGYAGVQALVAVRGGAVVAYGINGTAAVRTISLVPLRRRAAGH